MNNNQVASRNNNDDLEADMSGKGGIDPSIRKEQVEQMTVEEAVRAA